MHALRLGGSSRHGGEVSAVVSERAAALRALRVGGRDLLEPTVMSDRPPGMAGAILAPWPNRVEGARWTHAGHELQLAVTEPELGHANHGLLLDTDFEALAAEPGSLLLGGQIGAQTGYPFSLEVRVQYRLHRLGIEVVIAVRNDGDATAPVAIGAHPYLRVPAGEAELQVDADTAHTLDDAFIPRERFPVGGTWWDLRQRRAMEDAPSHATYEHAGPARELVHSLTAPDGSVVEVRADADFRWTQLYVHDALAADDGPRRAVAIEPMTAPPNALRTGIGLRRLEPGESWRVGYGIRVGQPSSRAR
jgi:aldose 1-epimerase